MKKFISMMLGLVLALAPVSAFGAETALVDKGMQILETDALTEAFIKEADHYEVKDGNFVFEKVEEIKSLKSLNSGRAVKTDENIGQYRKNILVVSPVDDETYLDLKDAVNSLRQISRSSAGGSETTYDWDSTMAVKAYLTIDYSIKHSSAPEYEGVDFYRIDEVSGNYKTPTDGVQVTKQKVEFGMMGVGVDKYAVNVSKSYSPTSQSWYYTSPSSWKAISINGSVAVASATYKLTLKRGSTWQLDVYNSII